MIFGFGGGDPSMGMDDMINTEEQGVDILREKEVETGYVQITFDQKRVKGLDEEGLVVLEGVDCNAISVPGYNDAPGEISIIMTERQMYAYKSQNPDNVWEIHDLVPCHDKRKRAQLITEEARVELDQNDFPAHIQDSQIADGIKRQLSERPEIEDPTQDVLVSANKQ
jgi:hypothetical protein